MNVYANENVEKILDEAPFFSLSKVGEDLYRRFCELKKVLETRSADDPHQLNPRNVTGVWYFTDLKFEEGNPQLLVRTKIPKKSNDFLLLCAEIHNIVEQDAVFDYRTDIFVDGMIIGQKHELCGEITANRILTVYDSTR